jgi:DNA polymerase
MPNLVPPVGPRNAKIMIVGEAPGAGEDLIGQSFVGASGMELGKMLSKSGIIPGQQVWYSQLNRYGMDWTKGECFLTNVVREHPPYDDMSLHIYENKTKVPPGFTPFHNRHISPTFHQGLYLLYQEISQLNPNIIIALGNTPLWALTGQWGITDWRGSMMTCLVGSKKYKLIPTIHPAAVLREWSFRPAVINDLRRAVQFRDGSPYPKPLWNFHIRPTFELCYSILHRLIDRLTSGESLRISFDLETRVGHIACAGISWNPLEALCIPFMSRADPKGYWDLEQESIIIYLLYLLLTHPLVQVIGQNLLYDCQYTYRHWRFIPRVTQDTIISQHSLFSDQPKALAYQASIYCKYYFYWKNEGKEFNAGGNDEDRGWYYNCEDCVYTDEVAQVEIEASKRYGLEAVHAAQQRMFYPVLRTMIRGVRIDTRRRDELIAEVKEQVSFREETLKQILGHSLNPRSPKQMKQLFYEDLHQDTIKTRAKKGKPGHVTLNDEALQKIAHREPLLRPVINCISDIRTLGIFLSNFLCKALDTDGRMRCAYNIGGSESGKSAPKTYRLSSSENAFGSGANLQAVPSDKSKSAGKAKARGNFNEIGAAYALPNLRSMFVPDPGYTFCDMDLDRADLQVVVWEAEDEMLKAAMRMGADIHLLNAFVLDRQEPPPLEELVESHPRYRDHRGPKKLTREFAKVFCHGTNYCGKPPTMAAHTGRTIHEIDRAQRLWFGAHPGILRWHKRIENQISRRQYVENKFGYRWYIFDRLDSILAEAVAWIPQSTVSNVINKIWEAFDSMGVEVLMQVHDSLCFQTSTSELEEWKPRLKTAAQITIPYDDPLIIPVGFKWSETSWGDC